MSTVRPPVQPRKLLLANLSITVVMIVSLPALLIFVASIFPANIGRHSLWLSAFGDTVHCRVETVEEHRASRAYNLLFLAGLLMNAAFILFVVRRPIRATTPAVKSS